MKPFMPERVLLRPAALKYPLGRKLCTQFKENDVEIIETSSRDLMQFIPGRTPAEKYARAKRTVVVMPKKSSRLYTCKPSADFAFSLVSGCPGHCEYCYLHTTQGYKPYLKIYVNIEEIFETIRQHIAAGKGNEVSFEAASGGDPLALEHLTGSLAKAIEFFGEIEKGRLRVATKSGNVDSLLGLRHNGHTHFRFSVNTGRIIGTHEQFTASMDERIEAASRMAGAGYPIGFIIAPIMIYDDWKKDYRGMFEAMKGKLPGISEGKGMTFELIQHRFTPAAKRFIIERFPKTELDLDENKRVLKWGKYGRFKYVYPPGVSQEIKDYISGLIKEHFPASTIEYFT